MADLLECLLQIKGLRETAERLRGLVGDFASSTNEVAVNGAPSVPALIADLAEAERLYGGWLRSILSDAQPALADHAANRGDGREPCDRPALERFLDARRDNLQILDRCSAEDLARWGVHARRRRLTVADLVAVMLARDTETLGKIREALRRDGAR